MGTVLPCLEFQGFLTHTCANFGAFLLIPVRLGWLSHSYDHWTSSPTCPRHWWVGEEGNSPRLMPPQDRWEVATLSYAYYFGAGLPTPALIELTLLCCPGEVQGMLSRVFSWLRSGMALLFLGTPGQSCHMPQVLVGWGGITTVHIATDRWGIVTSLPRSQLFKRVKVT